MRRVACVVRRERGSTSHLGSATLGGMDDRDLHDLRLGNAFGHLGAVGADRLTTATTGATNLLRHACAAIRRDDAARARAFVDRAIAIPVDGFHEVHPAEHGITDVTIEVLLDAEAEGPLDDGTDWLDVARDIQATMDEFERTHWRTALIVLAETEDIDDNDRARLVRIVGRRYPKDDPAAFLGADGAERMLSLLRGIVTYERLALPE